MRALLGLLFLGFLFVMAAKWQSRTTRGQHQARAHLYNRNSDASFEDDWSILLVGRHSGGEPIPVPEDAPGPGGQAAGGSPDGPGAGGGAGQISPSAPPGVPTGVPPGADPGPPPARIPPDRVYTVKADDVLGSICQRHYDRPPHQVVDLVAEYNDLPSPDAIREGDVLLLPAEVVFFPDG